MGTLGTSIGTSSDLEILSQSLGEPIPETLKTLLEGQGGTEGLHLLLCGYFGTNRSDGKTPWTKSALIKEGLKLDGRKYQLGVKLWAYLELQYGEIE